MFDADIEPENQITIEGEHTGALDIEGRGNVVHIHPNAKVAADICIRGDNNRVVIGEWSDIQRTHVSITSSGSSFEVGPNTGIIQSGFHIPETSSIRFGKACAVAAECWFSTSDFHPVYDESSGRRINPARDIILGDEVWIGFRCIILKGSSFEDGAILGAGSVARGRLKGRAISIGNPAKPVKSGVTWGWEF